MLSNVVCVNESMFGILQEQSIFILFKSYCRIIKIVLQSRILFTLYGLLLFIIVIMIKCMITINYHKHIH